MDYWLDITNTTASPDGFERQALLVNGSLPGPTIEANWGDTIVVHVTNSMQNNGSSIHWHGLRQNQTNQQDGVPSITQCPIAPGQSYTYTFRATEYGHSWYHSHYSLQAWDGVFGGILIHGPATSNYDEDLGVLFLNDWSHDTSDALYSYAQTVGPPTMDNGLINGTNVWESGGERFEMAVTSGTSYRLRLVNAAMDTFWKFSIDNHTFTVIAADMVPIEPFTTDYIGIGIGQRYDLILNANQTTSDYWMRAVPQVTCSDNNSTDNIRGIVRYDSSSTSDPTSTGYDLSDDCDDMPMASLVPYVSLDAGTAVSSEELPISIALNSENLFKWTIGTSVQWADPSLSLIENNQSSSTWTNTSNVISLTEVDEWYYFIIEEPNLNVYHPIHLHGHDFYILAQGTGTFDASTVTLETSNPPRRDVAMLPGSGYLVIGFPSDNPGAWLMHCHIGWHTSEGFALQFIEREGEIQGLIDESVLNGTCTAWDSFANADDIVEDDSGV
ncbi:MAG: hypothetical protein Q9227_008702 [Pyrenula ochraceoflavens]